MAIPQFRNLDGLASCLGSLENRVVALESENASLKHYIQDLGGDATKILPKTGLISPGFLARAFAVWEHYFVAQLIIGLAVMCI